MTSGERRRWPTSVYGGGEEPDPRFSLANERTFLAWIRTTLAILGAAAALDVVHLPVPSIVQHVVAVLLAVCGTVTAGYAFVGWARTERAMRHRRPLPGSPMTLPLVTVLVAVALTLVIAYALRLAQ